MKNTTSVTEITYGNNLPQQFISSDGHDCFVAKFDSSGQIKWSTYIGGNGSDYLECIESGDNGIVSLCGYSSSLDSLSTPGCYQPNNNGYDDAFLMFIDDNLNSIFESVNDYSTIEISPNPAKEYINVKTKLKGTFRLDVINMLGHKIYSTTSFDNNFSMNASFFSSDIYVLEISTKLDSWRSKLIINR